MRASSPSKLPGKKKKKMLEPEQPRNRRGGRIPDVPAAQQPPAFTTPPSRRGSCVTADVPGTTALAPGPSSPRHASAPRSAGLRSRRRGRPAAAPRRTPRRPRSPPLPGAAATAPRARAAAGSAPGARGHRGGGSSRAGAHRDTGALARHRAAFIDDPPRASHGGAFGRLLGLRLLPLVLRLHGGEEQHLLQRATPSARATPPARRAQRKSRESAARLGPAPARGRERRSAARAASGGGATPAASRAPLGGTVWQLASRPQRAPPLPFTLMLLESVRNMAKRSIPMPQPAVGGRPYSSAVQKFSSINMASSSPAAFA